MPGWVSTAPLRMLAQRGSSAHRSRGHDRAGDHRHDQRRHPVRGSTSTAEQCL